MALYRLLRSSCGLPQTVAFHLCNVGGGEFVLTLDTPAGDQDNDSGRDKVEDCQPPYVPDQRKAHDRRKESGNETGWAVARQFDRFIYRLGFRQPRAPYVPKRGDSFNPMECTQT